ncbi:WD repeat-containing protein 75 isoform X2 [Emydura macquarii macquarii]|uniref:WD repeat-containing protein 75 isoform X2 n=1 Tax=Emydura macquarii macquarii TaxID=1129001 RepID=UPI00352AB544
MVAQPLLRVVRCGGSRLSGARAAFSADAKYLFCASGDYVKVYSTATEECVHILQGHTNLVTGIQLNPQNHMQLYSCSLDGTIKLWDFTDGILIKTFVVGYKLFAFYTLAGSEDSVFIIIPKKNKEASGSAGQDIRWNWMFTGSAGHDLLHWNQSSTDSFQLVSVKLPKIADQEVEAKELSLILDDIGQSPKCTAFGREKKVNRFSLSATSTKGANNNFTCVACHPKEDCIASGHEDGKIRLWRNFNHKREYTFSTLHWHHDVVMDLTFSVEGTSLLSGGVESVLVQWRDGSDCKKEFLPRLGSTIEHISASPDGTFYCTCHTENKITIIHSNLRVSAVIQGLVKGSDVKTGLVVDPRTKALVLNGKPGHLQFYCLQTDKQLYNLDIVQQEYIHQVGLNQIDLVKAAFSAQGSWLATVEQREGKETELELQMKLWNYDEQTQSFTLNTRINMPHESHVTALCFRDTDELKDETLMLVTASKDGRFKVWVLVDDSDAEKPSMGWSCDFVGSYHKYPASNCCFSEDGSLLAVSFEKTVTVWDSDTWDLKCTFCHPPGKIQNLCFGRLSCSKYLLGTTSSGFLCCWNLLSCAMEWSAQLNITVLQPDPLSENIVAVSWLSEGSDLFVFKPNEPRPLCIQRNVCRGRVQWAVFIPREVPESVGSEKHQWLSRSQLYFLTETQDLMTFSTKSTEERLTPSSKQLAVEESLTMTPFYLLLGKHRHQQQSKENADLGTAVVQNHLAQHSPAVKELLHTPAHVLPSASFLCSIFINSMLISKENKSAEEVAGEVEMDSEKAEDESDEDVEFTEMEPDTNPTEILGETTPKLSKSQEKELRKIRRMDYSWITAL